MVSFRISKTRARRCVMRGMVLLFLFYTAADIVYPQICGEEFGKVASSNSSLPGAAAAVPSEHKSLASADDDAQRNQPQNQEPRDEDCFCCCAHVIAGMMFVPPVMPHLKLARTDHEFLATPQNEFENPNPPPRLV
ncbi:MAG TPA: hypothetical protein VJS64_19380 [Pyrinomonadaceae bacterium]|nr:hypothetical protein [Pyrinomonadaceae bacterium]